MKFFSYNIRIVYLFKKLQKRKSSLIQAVPTFFLNDTIVQGYISDEQTGKQLKQMFQKCRDTVKGCQLLSEFLESKAQLEFISSGSEGICDDCEKGEQFLANSDKYTVTLWPVGKIDLSLLSLPTLSILLGFLDGFNPCAMWVLITLITLLISTHDMSKILIIGGTFLLVSGVMYYLFIAAWLNVFLLIGYNFWVQKIISLIAMGAGGFYFYEAFGRDPNVCMVTDIAQRQKIIGRMKQIIKVSVWPAMLIGVTVLAISVNMIELVCTAGLPAIFTQIIAFNEVSDFARYVYILLYVILYMIDDTIIFAIAIFTLHAAGLTSRYRRLTLIIGGGLIYSLGILLLFAPEALMF